MANYVFDYAKQLFARGILNFNEPSDGLFRIALVTSDMFNVNNINTKTLWSEISQYHIINNAPSYNIDGYPKLDTLPDTLPGSPLTNVDIITIGDDIKVFADDIVYNSSTIDAGGAVVVRSTGTSGVYNPICALDFGGNKSSNNGAFKLKLSSSSGGFLTIQ